MCWSSEGWWARPAFRAAQRVRYDITRSAASRRAAAPRGSRPSASVEGRCRTSTSLRPDGDHDGMTHRSCDASGLLVAFRAGVANLEAQVEHVNAMNVFPVPDRDTGSNMVATARAALAEAERDEHAEAGLTAAAIGRGASFGAQGN